MPKPPKTVKQTIEDLKRQPGIDIRKMKPGTKIMVETTQGVYDIEVVAPSVAMIDVSGTEPRLHQKLTGQLRASHLDVGGQVGLTAWIGKNLRMAIQFGNAIHNCSPALSAKVSGPDWSYDVF